MNSSINLQIIFQTKSWVNIKRTINNPVCALKDYRFFELVKKFKRSIFLTGTPTQGSLDDVILITKFLNLKELNSSNNTKLANNL